MEIISRFTEYKKKVGLEPLGGTATYGVRNQGRYWQNYREAIGVVGMGPVVRNKHNSKLKSFPPLLPNRPRFAVEFRHRSWLRPETYALLERHNAAYTIVDEPLLPPDVHVTSDFAYIRWHGRGSRVWYNYRHSEKQLQEWIPRVNEAGAQSAWSKERVLGYFNNHSHGYAPENSLQIMPILGTNTPHSETALRGVSFYREGKPSEGLEAWTGPVVESAVEKLLLTFANAASIDVARSMPKKDFSLREESRRALAAYIGDTTVDINLEARIIVHRCPTWAKSSLEQKFCPHIVKLFLSINQERARAVLALIQSNLNGWKFQSRLAVEFLT